MTLTRADKAVEFADFYSANFHRIAAQLYAYLGDHAEAQDIAQEAFVRALDRWAKIGTYAHPVVWVRQVAWNLATSRLRHLRVAARHRARQRIEHADGPSPDRVALIGALAKLPPKHRLAVVLHHLGELSTAEIAEQEGVAEGTVRSWLSRGRAQLAAQFDETLAAVGDTGIRPPGPAAATVAVRRRRSARRAAVAAAIAIGLAIPIAILWRGLGGEPPIIGPTPSPSVVKRAISIPGTPDALVFLDGRNGWLLQGTVVASTSDGGVTWRRQPVPEIAGDVILQMRVADADMVTLQVRERGVGTPREILVTSDGGASWTSHPWANPPIEAQLAVGGPYQMRCPGDTGLELPGLGHCERRDLVKVGEGPVSPQPPLRASTVGAATEADGRIWLVDGHQRRLAVSADGAKTWQELSYPPGVLQFSADGSRVWVFGDGDMWELVGQEWRRVLSDVEGHWAVYLGEGVWLVRPGEQAAYFQDGRYTYLPELGPVTSARVLPDGTVALGGQANGLYLGYGTGRDRTWVLVGS